MKNYWEINYLNKLYKKLERDVIFEMEQRDSYINALFFETLN